MEQLQQAIGLTGELVTPQEAAAAYQREHQELSAQMVFFSASNYLSSVIVTPAAVDQFYTNFLAEYRLPDRVQVSYVAFEVTNYLARPAKSWPKPISMNRSMPFTGTMARAPFPTRNHPPSQGQDPRGP